MSNKVLNKRNATPGLPPAIADLDLGEIAINDYNGIVYSVKNAGAGKVIFSLMNSDFSNSTGSGLNLATQVTGTLAITHGGSGQVTANAALNAFLPSQGGNSGKFLKTDGSNTSWSSSGFVSSVDVSGGGTGLTFTGGPITSSGTITMSGTLSIGNGGTGQATQTLAFNALSPLTTKGDLIVHNGTNNVRLAVGTNGFGIVADSTAPNGLKWVALPGTGTVTSVALTAPVEFSVAGSPVTTAGTLALSWANEAANKVFAGPSSGGATTPTFRSLVNADFPTTGVSANTYNNVTVNAQGLITSGSNVAYLTGNQTITLSGDVTGSGATAITTTLASVGTAGTYVKVTTDAKGRVTSGSASPQAIADGGTGQTSKTAAFDALSPLTTKGDLIGFNTGHNTRVGVGTDGQILTAKASATNGWEWDDPTINLNTQVTGTLQINHGGTGATTASGAFDNIMPAGVQYDILANDGTGWKVKTLAYVGAFIDLAALGSPTCTDGNGSSIVIGPGSSSAGGVTGGQNIIIGSVGVLTNGNTSGLDTRYSVGIGDNISIINPVCMAFGHSTMVDTPGTFNFAGPMIKAAAHNDFNWATYMVHYYGVGGQMYLANENSVHVNDQQIASSLFIVEFSAVAVDVQVTVTKYKTWTGTFTYQSGDVLNSPAILNITKNVITTQGATGTWDINFAVPGFVGGFLPIISCSNGTATTKWGIKLNCIRIVL